VYVLVRDYRAHVPGSRLAARMVSIFSALAVVPLLVVYLFALSFLTRGIDTWFTKSLGRGLADAVDLATSTLDQREQEQGRITDDLAAALADRSGADFIATLEAARVAAGARKLSVIDRNGLVLAATPALTYAPGDDLIAAEILPRLQSGQSWSFRIPDAANQNQWVISTATSIPDAGGDWLRFVLMQRELPPEQSDFANAVLMTNSAYLDTQETSGTLKYRFSITLTLVLLLAMLSAIFLAIRAAARLTRPVHDLIEGTRAVGKGDFATRLALPSRDEMGYLVHSFNDMTKRLRRASEEASRSRAQVEAERERLAVILAGLSTGVIVIDTAHRIVLANAAADAILGTPMERCLGIELDALDDDAPPLASFA
jgi:nitrogen fixation/metabolism regulation signal transduction histidine kinase